MLRLARFKRNLVNNSLPCCRFRFLAWANPMGCSLMSSNLIPPSLRPARVRGDGRFGPADGDEPKPPTLVGVAPARESGDAKPPMCRLGMPFKGVVSVIFRGIPRERRGTVGAGFFFRLF